MRTGMLAFAAGVFSATFLPERPPDYLLWMAFVLLPLLFYKTARLPVLYLLGITWFVVYIFVFGPPRLKDDLEGRTLTVTGQIVSIPDTDQRRSRFDFKIHQITEPVTDWRGTIRISWYAPEHTVHAGQIWQLRVKLKKPHGFMSPGGFDYEAWLLQKGIAATGYVREPETASLVSQTTTLDSLRESLGTSIRQRLQASPSSALLIALTNGDRQYIDQSQWQTLTRTGTSHLIAISGLHIGLVYGLLYWLGRWIWSRSATLCLYRPAQDIGIVTGMIAALIYAALAGFAIPTQRALIMLSVIALALWLRRTPSPLHTLLLALTVVLLIDPLSILATGFWLSFAAVAIIWLAIQHQQTQALSRTRQLIHIQLAIAVGMLPLTALFFHQVSVVAPVANLVAVPWLSLTVTPLALIGAVLSPVWDSASQIVFTLSEFLLEMLWPLLEYASQSSVSVMHVAHPGPVTLMIAISGITWLFMNKSRWRWLGMLAFLPLFVNRPAVSCDGCFQVDFLDVGQGQATVIQTRNHVLLYDTGPSFSADFDAGARVILPYLWHQGISHIDQLIVSHDDRDHAGGLESVLNGITVKGLLINPGSKHNRHPLPTRYCQAGQQWQWNQVRFEILHPDRDSQGNENDRSCVLRVSNAYHSVLLTGDIEAVVERKLIGRHGEILQSEIMLSPHHGSKTSSSPDFLDTVKAGTVVHSVGYRNRFRHPNEKVVSRYQQRGIQQLRTDQLGMIRFTISNDQQPTERISWRNERRRFWHHSSIPAGKER